MSVLRSTPKPIQLKYRCQFKISNQLVRTAYRRTLPVAANKVLEHSLYVRSSCLVGFASIQCVLKIKMCGSQSTLQSAKAFSGLRIESKYLQPKPDLSPLALACSFGLSMACKISLNLSSIFLKLVGYIVVAGSIILVLINPPNNLGCGPWTP